jgi:hypothetical protein
MAGKEFELGQTARTVAENIKRLRGKRSYAELSRSLSELGRPIPPLGLRRIEAGERRVDVDELMAFSFVFGVNPNALLLPPVRNDDEYGPSGAESAQPLSRVWAWADGLSPYANDDEESMAYFKLRARPGTVGGVRVRADSAQALVKQLDDLMSQLRVVTSSIKPEHEDRAHGND